jgi:hypothetical protein
MRIEVKKRRNMQEHFGYSTEKCWLRAIIEHIFYARCCAWIFTGHLHTVELKETWMHGKAATVVQSGGKA